jgi:hypothetical protein
MDLAVCIIGINDWHRYTGPCIDSIKAQMPEARLICLDNGSDPAYPALPGVYRSETVLSYPAAINLCMDLAGDADWYIVANNDVEFFQPIAARIAALNTDALHGFYTHYVFDQPYLSSWCYFIPRSTWLDIGRFDEAFRPMWFEDADYCIRAVKAGYGLAEHEREDWGIIHYAFSRANERTVYQGAHNAELRRNREYLREKHGL